MNNRKVVQLGIMSILSVSLIGCNLISNETALGKENVNQTKYEVTNNKNSEVKKIATLNNNVKPSENMPKEKSEFTSLPIKTYTSSVKYDLFLNDKKVSTYQSKVDEAFPEVYSYIDGILTFRGNNLRTQPSFGTVNVNDNKFTKIWEFRTGSSSWGGGSGWVGQPSIIKWPDEVRKIMNLKPEYQNKKDFKEVVYASLDGKIYFFDLSTGKQTRTPIDIKNPIKGSVALDPRGYPLLYVGQGIPETGEIGYRIFSLIDGKLLYFIKGLDSQALRKWGATDGAPLINRNTDTMIIGGENGLVYNIKLNTIFDISKKKISINPSVVKYRSTQPGIENSIAIYKNLSFFADNKGNLQSVDINTMKPIWFIKGIDDTDSTITLQIKDDTPYLFTGTEVDKQGKNGYSYLKKINGKTGDIVWETKYPAMSQLGSHPVNGGLLATPVMGKNDINNLVIFSIARVKKFNAGLMVALDKNTGKEVWRWEMPNYTWSSPVDIYTKEGKSYIIQGDSVGNLYLLEGTSGKILNKINLGANIESSPAIYNNTLVVGTRGGKFIAVTIK